MISSLQTTIMTARHVSLSSGNVKIINLLKLVLLAQLLFAQMQFDRWLRGEADAVATTAATSMTTTLNTIGNIRLENKLLVRRKKNNRDIEYLP